MKKINILGINLSVITRHSFREAFSAYLRDGSQHRIVTPNPEIVLAAVKDEEYFYLINTADMAIPDGIGLKFASWLLGKNLHRLSGSDIIHDVLTEAENKGLKIAVFNWDKGLSAKEDILLALKTGYPDLKCLVIDISRAWDMPYYAEANAFRPEIIFTTLGAPWQDKFNYRALSKMLYVKVAIGVGGAFDFLTGKIKRAPKFLRAIGLEWAWRLIKQPWRYLRIYRAVAVFPLKFLRWRFVLPHFYRPNVAVILYKKMSDGYYILLVERQGEINHWQLPQGGLDSRETKFAGAKEISEEIGCANFKIVKIFGFLYKYKFRPDDGNRGDFTKPPHKHNGYQGQKQGLVIAEFFGNDEEVKIKYWDHSAWRWVPSGNLIASLHAIRRDAARIYLNKFNEFIKNL